MYAKHNYDAHIATYKNSEHYSAIQTEVKGLKIDFMENKGRISFLEKSVLRYIYKNAKKIDVLNLFHFSKQTFLYGILYKFLNPKGFLFVKLDGYNETFAEGTTIVHSKKKLKNILLSAIEKRFLKKVDLLSIENKDGERLVKLMFPKLISKIMYLPVGVNDVFLKKEFSNKQKTFEEKENIILTTGRIGSEVKNHEMILRALIQFDLKDWKMVFVGPVTKGFTDSVTHLTSEHPHLKSKIIITGEISDRTALYEWYNRSKIFCMTSWNESFSLSIAEAFYFGNYIIGTEGVMSMKDITDNEKYGTILKPDDDKSLAQTLHNLINDQAVLKKLYPEITQFSHRHFVWSVIIDKLETRINSNN